MTYDNKAPWYLHRSRAQTQSINHQDFSVATTNRIRSASSLSAMFCHSLDKLGWSYSTVKCTANFVHIEVSNTKWSYRMDGSYRQTSHSPFCERSEEQLLKECRQLWHPLLRNAWARTATPQVPNSEWQPGPQRHRSLTVNDNLSYVCSLRLCHRYIRSHDCLYMYSIILSWIHMTYRTYMFELKQVYDQQAFFIRGVMSHAIVMATCTLLFIEPNDNKTTSLFQCCLQVRFYDSIIMFHRGKQLKRHFHCAADPRMIRARSETVSVSPQPTTQQRLLFALRTNGLYWKTQHFALRLSFQISPSTAPTTKSNTWTSPSTAPTTKSDTWTSPSTAPATKSDTWTSPSTAPTTKSDTWPSPSTAPTTKSDTWPSPSTAPATQNDSQAWSSSHMKRHFQCAEKQMSPSKLTKYCACHAK